MGHVDALSRRQIGLIIDVDDIQFQIQVAQERDNHVKTIRDRLERENVTDYDLMDGVVYKRNQDGKMALYVPHEMESNVIRVIHEKMGHLATEKTHEKLKLYYWFPNMRLKVERFVRNCLKCIMYATPPQNKERTLYPISKTALPFDTIHLDHFGPLPSIRSKRKHILVVVDGFTKFVKLYPCNTTSAKEVINALDKYFSYYSRPRRIVTDRGTCFTSLEFSSFLTKRNVSHIKVAVASPQANGQVERVNRVLKTMLGKLTDEIKHDDWVSKLLEVEYAMNNSIHSTCRDTPSRLLFGVEQRGVIVDEFTEYFQDMLCPDYERDLTQIRDRASKAITARQEYDVKRASKGSPSTQYIPGDYVVIRNVDTTAGSNKKFIPRYRGPYVIHKSLGNDRYVVRDIGGCQLTQLPYDGVIEAHRIKRWVQQPDECIELESDPLRDYSEFDEPRMIEGDHLSGLAEL
ncbi:uncharacterized protein K02A2.6-like [Anastrepha ludens]|uniref:uncharacterized protein K02A2.6-like n=1 Tax=Anastrepha ludens TaxID=28586 RepID=UPI0023B10EC4|nr:uncharacterized protein K02A2.6-like [Anastrepha ludens]